MAPAVLPTNNEEWLQARLNGIGASEAAAVIGQSPWCSNVELWKRKTGLVKAPDISNEGAVKYGHDAEPLIRGLFALDYADRYQTDYLGAYDMVHNPEHPFIFATLDGRLTELATGRLGILEIKTTSIVRSMQKEKWWKDGQPCIPQQYFIQVLHQMLATGFDFAVLHAQLKYQYGDEIRSERRTYHLERSDYLEDLDYLQEAEIQFWQLVKTRTPPALILPEI